jgi:hypothetical protein
MCCLFGGPLAFRNPFKIMKIIAKIASGYIVQATEIEVANILGYPSLIAPGYLAPREGDVVGISTAAQDAPKVRQELTSLRTVVDAMSAQLTKLGF